MNESRCRAALLVALVLALLCQERAFAAGISSPGLRVVSVGVSGGFAAGFDQASGFATTVDLTYGHEIDLAGVWGSVGARLIPSSDGGRILPYVEAGLFFVVNAGIGYSYGGTWGEVAVNRHNVHAFLGLPIPLMDWRKSSFMLLEPYYRPTFGVGSKLLPTLHEVGVLIKWAWGWV